MREWAKLHALLFPELSFDESLDECAEWLKNKKEAGVLYEIDEKYVGFINLSIRNDYVNGTDKSPVSFIEAIYVLPEYRGQGIGRELMEYAEKFAKENGTEQIGSDCFIDNELSAKFHESCGFAEKERVICFVKDVM